MMVCQSVCKVCGQNEAKHDSTDCSGAGGTDQSDVLGSCDRHDAHAPDHEDRKSVFVSVCRCVLEGEDPTANGEPSPITTCLA